MTKPVSDEYAILPDQLEPRFADIKKQLVKPENIEAVTKSWKRLLKALEIEAAEIAKEGSSRVPTFEWSEIKKNNFQLTEDQLQLFRHRGSALVKGVVDREQIEKWFDELVEFVKEHPESSGFLFPNNSAMYNVFWTKPQTEARFHPDIVKLVKLFGNTFHVEDQKNSYLDLDTQIVYGDRIRIRQPGQPADLPLHLDSSSIERWEDTKFRDTYKEIFEGNWEDWDAWKLDERQYAQEDLYKHLGEKRSTNSICSSFRTLQGWLSLSDNKSGEGTLRVLPSIKLAISYILLRPLFSNDPALGNIDDYEIDLKSTKYPGTKPAFGQILVDPTLFPHLQSYQSVVGIPDVNKGDFIFWHADLPHEVDPTHEGPTHSSVFYYSIAPLAPGNIETLLDTRDSWKRNVSPIDFRSQQPPGTVEYQGADDKNLKNEDSKRSLGLAPFDLEGNLTEAQKNIRKVANRALEVGSFDLQNFLKENDFV